MKVLIAITSSVLLAAGSAFAGDAGQEKTFSELDVNQDGALTQTEAAVDQELLAEFTVADTNQDGMLSNVEFDEIQDDDDTEDAE